MTLVASTNRTPLDCAAIVDEAVERAGIDPASMDHRKLISIQRSLVLLTIEIEGSDADEEDYQDQIIVPFSANQRAAVLPADTMDILDAVALLPATTAALSFGSLPQTAGANPDAIGTTKIPMIRISRAEDIYQQQVGVPGTTPLQYWVTRTAQPNVHALSETGYTAAPDPLLDDVGAVILDDGGNQISIPSTGTTNTYYSLDDFGNFIPLSANYISTVPGPMIVVWPVPQTACTLALNRLRLISLPASLSDRPDMRRNWTEAICAGLAFRAASKWNVERAAMLKGEWVEQREKAHMESRERAPLIIGVRAFGRARRRRI